MNIKRRNNGVSVYSIVLPHCSKSLSRLFSHAEPSVTMIFYLAQQPPVGLVIHEVSG